MQPERLKKRQQFVNVANQGQKIVSSGLILQSMKIADEPAFKLGFTVTKKVGNAVIRNRVRRRLKAVAQKHFAEHAKTGRHYVIIGRQSTITRDFKKLESDLITSLNQVR